MQRRNGMTFLNSTVYEICPGCEEEVDYRLLEKGLCPMCDVEDMRDDPEYLMAQAEYRMEDR